MLSTQDSNYENVRSKSVELIRSGESEMGPRCAGFKVSRGSQVRLELTEVRKRCLRCA
jgi:hypothetical protein